MWLRSVITLHFNEIPMSHESGVWQWFSSCQRIGSAQGTGYKSQVTGIQHPTARCWWARNGVLNCRQVPNLLRWVWPALFLPR